MRDAVAAATLIERATLDAATTTHTVQGCVTSKGLLQFTAGANLVVTRNCLTNHGTINIMTVDFFIPGPERD